MAKGFVREIALLTTPVLAIAAVALWKSRPAPPGARPRPTPSRPTKSVPPVAAPIRWEVSKVDPKGLSGRFYFEARSGSPITARSGLPAGVQLSALGWQKFKVSALRVKRHGQWSVVPVVSGEPIVKAYTLTSSSQLVASSKSEAQIVNSQIGLRLRGVPPDAQAVRLKLTMLGAVQYSGTWPAGMPLPKGVRVKSPGRYEESLMSPPSEIEMKAVWFERRDKTA